MVGPLCTSFAKGLNFRASNEHTIPLGLPDFRSLFCEREWRPAPRFITVRETNDAIQRVAAHPPDWSVKALDARGNYPGIRVIQGIVGFPILHEDGTVRETPGYDPATGLIYEPTCETPKIGIAPTHSDAIAARDRLLDVVSDFPFEKPAHRSTWLAVLLTPLSRHTFAGPAPLFAFDANAAGSGKTLLAETVSITANGRDVSRMANPRDDEECRKLLLALAICGDTLVLIDNIAGTLGCASLDAALTGTSWRDRVLGRSEIVDLPLAVTWLATGNNIICSADTSRRVAHCRLDCRVEHPEERDGFRYPDLKSHVKEHRGELLSAALTILRAYIIAGKPRAALKPWGSYEGWSDLIRQCIVWLGMPDPGDTREQLRSTADGEAARLNAILAGLAEADKTGAGMTTAEILRAADTEGSMRDAIWELCDASPGKPPTARMLGNRLKRFRGRVHRGQALEMGHDGKGFARWTVVTVSDSADSSESVSAIPYARTQAYAYANRPEIESRESDESEVWLLPSERFGDEALEHELGDGTP